MPTNDKYGQNLMYIEVFSTNIQLMDVAYQIQTKMVK